MKILFLTSELTIQNGWGRYSQDVIQQLASLGYDIEIAISSKGRNESNEKVLNFLPKTSDLRKIYFLAPWYAFRLARMCKNYDAIHALVEPYAPIAFWLSRFSKKPFLVTAHGTYATLPFSFSKLPRSVHAEALRSAKQIVCVSFYTEKMLAKHGLRNTTVINNGLNYGLYKNLQLRSFEERENLVVSVGALKQRKGQHILIEAFAKIAKKYSDARCVIVGAPDDGKYYQLLKNLVAGHGLEEKISFLHGISDKEKNELYSCAKAFSLTSINKDGHYEGFGLVYLEANAHGTPVIGSKKTGADDAILDKKTGFLIEQCNSGELAEQLSVLFSEKEIWNKLSRNSVAWAKEHDWSSVIGQYAKIYETL